MFNDIVEEPDFQISGKFQIEHFIPYGIIETENEAELKVIIDNKKMVDLNRRFPNFYKNIDDKNLIREFPHEEFILYNHWVR